MELQYFDQVICHQTFGGQFGQFCVKILTEHRKAGDFCILSIGFTLIVHGIHHCTLESWNSGYLATGFFSGVPTSDRGWFFVGKLGKYAFGWVDLLHYSVPTTYKTKGHVSCKIWAHAHVEENIILKSNKKNILRFDMF